jgi:hypothetical protein
MEPTDAELALLAAFEAGELSPDRFHHRDHVQVAWICLRQVLPAQAISRFADGLRRFARAIGREELYHETITWAYLLLIHERRERGTPESRENWEAFTLQNADLFGWNPSVLTRYYRQETLQSDLARTVFLMPDKLQEPSS